MDLITAYQMFGDIWKFYKRFQEVQNSDAYWERAISEAGKILEKYQTELCKQLLMDILEEFDRRGINESVDAR